MSNFLSRLELQGFKSFASKTIFELSDRVVGIVGPNGSGKSNIIDAVRWTLGEREAKNLRGDVLGNLIFAGTPKKPAASLAKVNLVFNNNRRIFPVDAEEVVLTRKIDRSGVSRFYINDEEVKMKNLIPMLAKAKLGHRGLTIIGQGQSDVFVRIGPEERREMIEEILGLKEYRLKKKSAEGRLKQSRINMDYLKGKIEEITPHLKFLKKQKTKWEKRKEIEEKLGETASSFFSFHYHSFNKELEGISQKLSSLRNRRLIKEKEVKILSSKLDETEKEKKYKEEIASLRKEMQRVSSQIAALTREEARLEAKIEFQPSSSQTKNYSSSYLLGLIKSFVEEVKAAIRGEKEKLEKVLNAWINNFENLFKKEEIKMTADRSELEKLKKKVKLAEEQLEEMRKKEENLLTNREEDTREFRAKVEDLEKKKSELREIDYESDQLMLQQERIQFKMRELENKWISLGYYIDELKNLPVVDKQEEDWDKIERRIERLRAELIAVGEIDKELIKEAQEMEERYEFLIKELEDLESASKNLEKLIKDLEKKIHEDFKKDFGAINKEFNNYFRLMFNGGRARLKLSMPRQQKTEEELGERKEERKHEEKELEAGVEIELNLPRKKITSLDMLSGGEKSLVSLAALFALISVSPPPFLILDEIDATLDEVNARRFAELIKEFSEKTQFIIVTHNRVTMEVLNSLYGITMGEDGVSRVLSLRLEEAKKVVTE